MVLLPKQREREKKRERNSSLGTDLELSASIELLEAVHSLLAVYDRCHSFTLLKEEMSSTITPENSLISSELKDKNTVLPFNQLPILIFFDDKKKTTLIYGS